MQGNGYPVPESEFLTVQIQEVVMTTAVLKCLLQAPSRYALIKLRGDQIKGDSTILQTGAVPVPVTGELGSLENWPRKRWRSGFFGRWFNRRICVHKAD